ncbi:tigger transposable element-derived protein 4 [Elysia marginata]|uniref:Tigger transposable element-derived protein 4 n=1 Tax=Elysia marginata TaxID=1093978 RepID=A0AAV4I182_9GAST|nr:tigger transposable element-derived protein 4 [Elysia marginata]
MFQGIEKTASSYDANKSAWMTSTIFDTWLRDFHRTMALRGRKVVMIVDNCAAHPHVQNLTLTELVFLPPNVTSNYNLVTWVSLTT